MNLKVTLTRTWDLVLLCVTPAVIIVSNLSISKEPINVKWGFFKFIVLNIRIKSTTTNPLCICSCIRVLLKILILFYCGMQFARTALLFLPPKFRNLDKNVTWKNRTLWLMLHFENYSSLTIIKLQIIFFRKRQRMVYDFFLLFFNSKILWKSCSGLFQVINFFN